MAALTEDDPIPGFFRDDGTLGEELSGIPNGFREHVERVARGELDIETLIPNWRYIRQGIKNVRLD